MSPSSSEICLSCGLSPLVTKMELAARTCLDCIPLLAEELDSAQKQIQILTQARRIDAESLSLLRDSIAHRQSVDDAERDGITARKRGAEHTDNPHQTGTDEEIAWESGWHSINTEDALREMEALLFWIQDSLELVLQLAKGYDQKEISGRVETMMQKISDRISI